MLTKLGATPVVLPSVKREATAAAAPLMETGPCESFVAQARMESSVAEPAVRKPEPKSANESMLEPGPQDFGQVTSDAGVNAVYASEMFNRIGTQSLLTLNDQRIEGCAGYYLHGLESPFPEMMAVGILGDRWKAVGGQFEIKGDNAIQNLSFDRKTGETRLQSLFLGVDGREEEILTKSKDGEIRRLFPGRVDYTPTPQPSAASSAPVPQYVGYGTME